MYDGIIENYPENYDESFEIDHSGKLGVLNRLLDEFKRAGEKAVVVSNSTKTLDVVERLLKARQSAFLRLDGQTSTEERLKRVDRFNSKYSSEGQQMFVFVMTSYLRAASPAQVCSSIREDLFLVLILQDRVRSPVVECSVCTR